jgi:hypothetical protein
MCCHVYVPLYKCVLKYVCPQRTKKKKEFEQQSLFRGINYVFDNRIGQLVTADVPLHQLPSSRSTSAAAHTRLEGAEEEEEEEERGGEVVCDEGGRLAAAPAGPEPQVLCLLC